jgi:hypothetical protein
MGIDHGAHFYSLFLFQEHIICQTKFSYIQGLEVGARWVLVSWILLWVVSKVAKMLQAS